jgi:hypothetical protein
LGIGQWELGIGHWAMGIGQWGLNKFKIAHARSNTIISMPHASSRSILKWQIPFLAKDFERIRHDYLGKRAN